MKSLLRFSDVHLPDRLHNQLNRLVQFANENADEQTTRFATHDLQISELKTLLKNVQDQIKALQEAVKVP